ncbi:unnamed protein product [Cyclocybe aegerita]|uniref:Uncharacterized protein n=1 Tax=Cyclocybe aegerita TaxID=1973307 RepID=A0A8S0VZR3_CYCAE|nr:unnamed protein product [Cyclocybe aegerita]
MTIRNDTEQKYDSENNIDNDSSGTLSTPHLAIGGANMIGSATQPSSGAPAPSRKTKDDTPRRMRKDSATGLAAGLKQATLSRFMAVLPGGTQGGGTQVPPPPALTLPASTGPGATQNTALSPPTETGGDVEMAGPDPPQMQATQLVVDTVNLPPSMPSSSTKPRRGKKRKQGEGEGVVTAPSPVKKAKPERSLSPEFVRDPDVLRQMPSRIPRTPEGSKQDPILITKSNVKKLYRLKDKQIDTIPVFRVVETKDDDGRPLKVYLYREDLVEFEAWRAYGGYTRFVRHLRKLKCTYDKKYPEATRPATYEFPVSVHYKGVLEDEEKKEENLLCDEVQAAIEAVQNGVAEREAASSSQPATPKKDKGKGREK